MERPLGWLPELPDHRDFLIQAHNEPATTVLGFTPGQSEFTPTATSVTDITKYCSPIENQGALGSCVAQACVGMVEYLERRARNKHVDASRLFVYKMARTLDGFRGDTGAYIRSGIKSLAVFGAPPERYWKYDISKFDDDPPPFSYAYGQRFRAIRYYRLDSVQSSKTRLLEYTKQVLNYGLPVVFGFSVYNFGNEKGEFPMPEPGDRLYGGHAVLAVGFDDSRKIGKSVGALKIRNSWGTRWGEAGYGWLPYDYVTQRLSRDFWTIFSQQYLMD